MNYNDKIALVWDAGYGIEHAARLAKDFKEVYLYTPWQERAPKLRRHAPGIGLAPNLIKEKEFFKRVPEADLIVFTDVGAGDLAAYLRSQGKLVFGGGQGEMLEQDRHRFRRIQQKIGLPTQKTFLAHGVSSLRKFIKRHPDVFVKQNIFRGDWESFHAKDYESVELFLDQIQDVLGPFKEQYELLVEEAVNDAVQPGTDAFFSTQFYFPCVVGFEDDAPYIGKVCTREQMPPVMLKTLEALTPVMARLDYRAGFSTEERITNPNTSYLIDMTCRFAYVLSLIYTEAITNYTDLIWAVAAGEPCIPEFVAPYIGCLNVDTLDEDHWTYLDIPEKLRQYVKLTGSCIVDDKAYYVPNGGGTPMVLIAWGDTPSIVASRLKRLLDKVDCLSSDKNSYAKIDSVIKKIKDAKSFGVDLEPISE